MRKLRDIVMQLARDTGDWLDGHTNVVEAGSPRDYRFAIGRAISGRTTGLDLAVPELITMDDGSHLHPDATKYLAREAILKTPDTVPDEWIEPTIGDA